MCHVNVPACNVGCGLTRQLFFQESSPTRESTDISPILKCDDVQRKEDDDIGNSRSERFQCSVCGEIYVSSDQLSAHQCSHFQQGRTLRCGICLETFNSLGDLAAHLRVHTGVIVGGGKMEQVA